MFALHGSQILTTELIAFRNYSSNNRMLFDENYGLAATQSLKNKDIPEGGAKGTILPSFVILFLQLWLIFTFDQPWRAA